MTTRAEARVFVRGIQGDYGLGEEKRRMRSAPRVIKAADLPFDGGPVAWNKHIVTPWTVPAQTLFMHVEVLSPGGKSGRHGHQNEALFYILEGKGYEVHDGKRYDWEAGDAVIVHNGCIHQHFNANPDKPARQLVIKSKPLYNFMNLNEQGNVEHPPTEGGAGYTPDYP